MSLLRFCVKAVGMAAMGLCTPGVPAAPAVMTTSDAEKMAVDFRHEDWQLVCDNTRTCRAAGYQSPGGEDASEPVSLLITRTAGPNAPIEMQLQVAADEEFKERLRLKVGQAVADGLRGATAQLSSQQARTVLPQLLKERRAEVTSDDGRQWTLSLAGANAVLLKMDETQGRLGTPGALVRRGDRAESSVLPPVPAPRVQAAAAMPGRAADAALAAPIVAVLDLADARDQCNRSDAIEASSFAVHRLTADRVLLSLPCSMGAYNYSELLWIANDKTPYAPVAIEANGDFDSADMSVYTTMKGRGIADCIWSYTWHFDGRDFVPTRLAESGMCRGFPGGAWDLPIYVTRVEHPVAKQGASKKPSK